MCYCRVCSKGTTLICNCQVAVEKIFAVTARFFSTGLLVGGNHQLGVAVQVIYPPPEQALNLHSISPCLASYREVPQEFCWLVFAGSFLQARVHTSSCLPTPARCLLPASVCAHRRWVL